MPKALRYICPFCEAEVAVGKPCPGCTKKPKKPKPGIKSWEQDSSADGLNLPDNDFDYNDFVAREFGKVPHHKTGIKWYWWILAVVILSSMLYRVFG
ncbi:MAG: hypothetical protein ABI600_10220 [Luteolibacter sp.]